MFTKNARKHKKTLDRDVHKLYYKGMTNGNQIPQAYSFYDYREFLTDRLSFIMNRDKLTWRKLAEKLNLKSSGHLMMIAKGERPFPEKLAKEIFDLLEMNSEEIKFFRLLMDWNLSKPATIERRKLEDLVFSNPAFQKQLSKRIESAAPTASAKNLSKEYIDYFGSAMAIVVKELIGSDIEIRSAKDISGACPGLISLKRAGQILKTLESLGLICKKDGRFIVSEEMTDLTSDELDHRDYLAMQQKVNRQWLDAAEYSWENFPEEERASGGFTLSLTQDALEELVEKAQNMTRDLAYEAYGKSGNKDRVAHLQILVSPLVKSSEKQDGEKNEI